MLNFCKCICDCEFFRSKLGFRMLFSLPKNSWSVEQDELTTKFNCRVYVANLSCGLQQSPITKHVHTSESKWLWLKRTAVCVFLSGEHYRMQIPGQVWRCRRLGIFWRVPFSVSLYEDRKCKLQMNQPEGLSVIPKQTDRAQRGRETPVSWDSFSHTHTYAGSQMISVLYYWHHNMTSTITHPWV